MLSKHPACEYTRTDVKELKKRLFFSMSNVYNKVF